MPASLGYGFFPSEIADINASSIGDRRFQICQTY
jgi:hypothetical protein